MQFRTLSLLFALTSALFLTALIIYMLNTRPEMTTCTAASIQLTVDGEEICVLVSPLSGQFDFPYVLGRTAEQLGDWIGCEQVNRVFPCYQYYRTLGGKVLTSITLNKCLAESDSHFHALIFLLVSSTLEAVSFLLAIHGLCRRFRNRRERTELGEFA